MIGIGTLFDVDDKFMESLEDWLVSTWAALRTTRSMKLTLCALTPEAIIGIAIIASQSGIDLTTVTMKPNCFKNAPDLAAFSTASIKSGAKFSASRRLSDRAKEYSITTSEIYP